MDDFSSHFVTINNIAEIEKFSRWNIHNLLVLIIPFALLKIKCKQRNRSYYTDYLSVHCQNNAVSGFDIQTKRMEKQVEIQQAKKNNLSGICFKYSVLYGIKPVY